MSENLNLEPTEHGSLLGPNLCVQLQKNIGRYRVDFLINNHLIVEVDGRAYHENRFEYDRYRDQELFEMGYYTLRMPARQVLDSPSSAAQKVIEWAAKLNPEIKINKDTQEFEDDIPF